MAVTVTNLYQLQVPVANKTAGLRQQTLNTALQTVLTKLSGNSQVTQNSTFKAALANPQQYLQQYAYQSSDKGLMLDLRFSKPMIKNLLQSAGQAIWGANRPLLLIWFVENDVKGPHIITNPQSPIAKDLIQLAQGRSLPIIFPLLDITDLQSVSANILWRGDVKAMLKASARYVPDAVLLVHLDALDSKALNSTWTLYIGTNSYKWQVSGEDIKTVLQQGVDDVTDSLASQYAVQTSSNNSQSSVILQIEGLNRVADYARIMKYLNGLTAVKNIAITSLSHNGVVFTISLNGDVKALTREISLGRLLLSMQGTAQQTASQTLTYRYRG